MIYMTILAINLVPSTKENVMKRYLPHAQVKHHSNQNFSAQNEYPEKLLSILGGSKFDQALKQIQNWPNYKNTPLVELNELAQDLTIKSISYKDEAGRFGLGSFKALGGAYAVSRLLVKAIQEKLGNIDVSAVDLTDKKYSDITKAITVTCATDGNHGRSVAWGAQRFGCQCVIYIHATVSEGRKKAIEKYGAQVVRIDGNYDDAVYQAAVDAEKLGRFVVSDTSYEGYMEVPKDVMQGYAVMADEALLQFMSVHSASPTHVFLQGGVGGLAAAVVAHLWEKLGKNHPKFIVVEPDKAACLFESAVAGQPVAIKGELDTVMAGLACGEISLLAWEVLKPAVSDFIQIDDESALNIVRLLAKGDSEGHNKIIAGESAVAGLAAVLASANSVELREKLALDQNSRVLIFGSEGATDPELYAQIVGQSAEEVMA